MVLPVITNTWRVKMYEIQNKTGVSGSNPESPTSSSQAFAEYFDLVASSKSAKWDYETRRLLNQFREFIGEYPPSLESRC